MLHRVEIKVRDSWITNDYLDPTNQKIVKLPFFTDCSFFQKYENFKIISADDICLSICVDLNDER